MPRPSSFDRNDLIEQAMQELWRSGYEASSVKAMSEKLGITRSSYYNAFGAREDLFKETIDAYLDQSPCAMLRGDLPDIPVCALLTRMFRAVCSAPAVDPEARGCLMLNSLCEFDTTKDELGVMVAGNVLESIERFEELLQLALDNGELTDLADVHGTALALQNLLVGLNVLSKALHDEGELWLTAKTTLVSLGLYREDDHA